MVPRSVFTIDRPLSVRLAFLLLLPLIAIVVPLLARQWDSRASAAPLRVRQCLERVMSDGESPPPPLSRLWCEGIGCVKHAHVWVGERYDRKGRSAQAIYDEATDRVILFSREKDVPREVSDRGGVSEESEVSVRDAESAKAVARGFLRLLPSSDMQSWNLTAKLLILKTGGVGGATWFVRGIHNDRAMDIHIEPATGCILFYSEGRFADNAASRALAPGL